MLFLVLTAIAGAVTLVSGSITIQAAIKSYPGSKHRFGWGLTIVTLLLTLIFLFASLSSQQGSASGNTPAPASSTTQQGTGETPISTLSTQTQSPAQNPSPTTASPPSPGTVLCQGDSSWSGWNGTSDWHVSNRMLLDDGTDNTPGGLITSPCQLPVADYAVEVTMQVVNFQSCCVDNLGITLRSSSSGGYDVGVEIDSNHLAKISTDYTSLNNLATAHFDPGERVHTYRAEVKGNTIKLFVDGGLLVSATDNQYLDAGQVGLYSSFVQVDVTSFKVIAL